MMENNEFWDDEDRIGRIETYEGVWMYWFLEILTRHSFRGGPISSMDDEGFGHASRYADLMTPVSLGIVNGRKA